MLRLGFRYWDWGFRVQDLGLSFFCLVCGFWVYGSGLSFFWI